MTTATAQVIQDIERDAQQRIARIRQAEAEAAKVREANRLSDEQKAKQEADATIRKESSQEWFNTHVPELQHEYSLLQGRVTELSQLVQTVEQGLAAIAERYPKLASDFNVFGDTIVNTRMGLDDASTGLVDREFTASDAIGEVVENDRVNFRLPDWIYQSVRNRAGFGTPSAIMSESFYSQLAQRVKK